MGRFDGWKGYSKEQQAQRKPKRKSKYKNKRKGAYRSGLESDYADWLDWMKMAGEVEEWEHESKRCSIKLEVNGKTIGKYLIDFWVKWSDGREEFIEVKGPETQLWRFKYKLAKAIYPGLNFRTVKKVPKI